LFEHLSSYYHPTWAVGPPSWRRQRPQPPPPSPALPVVCNRHLHCSRSGFGCLRTQRPVCQNLAHHANAFQSPPPHPVRVAILWRQHRRFRCRGGRRKHRDRRCRLCLCLARALQLWWQTSTNFHKLTHSSSRPSCQIATSAAANLANSAAASAPTASVVMVAASMPTLCLCCLCGLLLVGKLPQTYTVTHSVCVSVSMYSVALVHIYVPLGNCTNIKLA